MNTASKILSDNDLERVLNFQHHKGVEIALATGVFDVLHVGHVKLLESAAEHGILFVGVNDDESVRALKGQTRPINNERDRMEVLAALECVQGVFLIRNTTVTPSILRVRPNAWIKGSSYTLDTLNKEEVAAANEVGADIVLIPMVKGKSSTAVIDKL